MRILLSYLFAVNLFLFALMGIDKHRAKRNQWRIRESTLLTLAVIGGSLGGICGMLCFRHKTRHPVFRFGFFMILAVQILFIFGFFVWLKC